MAPTVLQSTRGQDCGIRSVHLSQQTSKERCGKRTNRGLNTFALTADVKEAHRQIPIDPRDWHLLGCQLERGGDVFMNTVGTFGISSASYCWSRVAGAIG